MRRQERVQVRAGVFHAPPPEQRPEAQVQATQEFVPAFDQVRVLVPVVQQGADQNPPAAPYSFPESSSPGASFDCAQGASFDQARGAFTAIPMRSLWS